MYQSFHFKVRVLEIIITLFLNTYSVSKEKTYNGVLTVIYVLIDSI